MTSPRPKARGLELDDETRCAHWRSNLDIVALRLPCCGIYYACRDCHDALAGHEAKVWPAEAWDEKVALCGACGEEMNLQDYLACEDRCPACAAPFNPGCRKHRHLYFEVAD